MKKRLAFITQKKVFVKCSTYTLSYNHYTFPSNLVTNAIHPKGDINYNFFSEWN